MTVTPSSQLIEKAMPQVERFRGQVEAASNKLKNNESTSINYISSLMRQLAVQHEAIGYLLDENSEANESPLNINLPTLPDELEEQLENLKKGLLSSNENDNLNELISNLSKTFKAIEDPEINKSLNFELLKLINKLDKQLKSLENKVSAERYNDLEVLTLRAKIEETKERLKELFDNKELKELFKKQLFEEILENPPEKLAILQSIYDARKIFPITEKSYERLIAKTKGIKKRSLSVFGLGVNDPFTIKDSKIKLPFCIIFRNQPASSGCLSAFFTSVKIKISG